MLLFLKQTHVDVTVLQRRVQACPQSQVKDLALQMLLPLHGSICKEDPIVRNTDYVCSVSLTMILMYCTLSSISNNSKLFHLDFLHSDSLHWIHHYYVLHCRLFLLHRPPLTGNWKCLIYRRLPASRPFFKHRAVATCAEYAASTTPWAEFVLHQHSLTGPQITFGYGCSARSAFQLLFLLFAAAMVRVKCVVVSFVQVVNKGRVFNSQCHCNFVVSCLIICTYMLASIFLHF